MINIPQDAAQQLLDVSSSERLMPPYIPTFYWSNGNKQLKESHPVLYFGGWKTDKETFDQIVAGFGKPYTTFEEFESISNEGASYDVYGARHLFVMPLRWIKLWGVRNEEGRVRLSKKYTEGSRSDLRYLCMFAEKLGDDYVTWGPIILKAVGLQSQNLINSLRSWKRYTEPARLQLTKELRDNGQWGQSQTIPEGWFWVPLGSFGKEPVFEKVGSGSNTSMITPIRTYTSNDPLSFETLQTLYVGEDNIRAGSGAIEETREWFEMWDNGENNENVDQDHIETPSEEEHPF